MIDALNQGIAVYFLTLGCAKNEVDTAHMQARTEAAGFITVTDPKVADAIIVNTCSFIQDATEESLDAIFEMCDLGMDAEKKPKVIVSGCMPSRYGEDLQKELTEVDDFVPCGKEDDIVGIIRDVLGIPESDVDNNFLEMAIPSGGTHFSYVKISDGCDRFCTYCTIPFIRGRYHSFSSESIFAEVDALVSQGVKEIILIAQDTGRWGQDFEEPSSLADLLHDLALRFPNTWFRVMYIQPEGVSDALIEAVGAHENICSYFDIPLQHVNADILKAMNRSGDKETFFELFRKIRSRIPGVMIRTTLIAGFPGETDDQFMELCNFVEEADFDYVGVFPYSQEEGTKAAEMINQRTEEEKLERAQTLRDIADSLSVARVSERIGKSYDVLVLGEEEDGQLYGRAKCQAPEVDGVVYLESGKAGDIVRVTIEDTLLYEMEGV